MGLKNQRSHTGE